VPGLRLFERMSAVCRKEDRQSLQSGERLLQSICDYVSRLLNSREGSTLLDPRFGMPDFIHSNAGFSPDDEPALRQQLVDFISRYEPRLQDVRVSFAPREAGRAALAFSITARLKGENEGVHLYSNVTPEGKIRVRL
jgi:type VI secretion system protein